jgi:hypothetical protein
MGMDVYAIQEQSVVGGDKRNLMKSLATVRHKTVNILA